MENELTSTYRCNIEENLINFTSLNFAFISCVRRRPNKPQPTPKKHAPTTTQTSNDVTNFDVAVVILFGVMIGLDILQALYLCAWHADRLVVRVFIPNFYLVCTHFCV